MPSLFADGMVLQQKTQVPVWGWGEKGTAVSVSFGEQTQTTSVAGDGSWRVTLNPLTASAKSAELTIKLGEESKTISDVLVGEVWICSGQSNMDFTLERLIASPLRTPEFKEVVEYTKNEVMSANDPLLRQIAVPHAHSYNKPLTDFKGSWIDCKPGNTGNFTAVGYFFGRELRKELKVPVGLIKCAWGGTRVEPWISAEAYQSSSTEMGKFYRQSTGKLNQAIKAWDPKAAEASYQKKLAAWKKHQQAPNQGKPMRKPSKQGRPQPNHQFPTVIFNGMIHPLIPYAIKGAIWYQGESNANASAALYGPRFSAMIESWRKAWDQGDFPFYYVQLANFKPASPQPKEKDGWATICNQQRLCLTLNNTGMAVINDIGEARDIHPKNKIDVGKRLALWALAKDYGKTELVCSGPLYQDSQIKGSKILVSFSSLGDGLMAGRKTLLAPAEEVDEPLKGFQICGADRKWKWATAKIVGDHVEVSHPEIKEPMEVRYAWSSNPADANLYNRTGLPTSVFKTTK